MSSYFRRGAIALLMLPTVILLPTLLGGCNGLIPKGDSGSSEQEASPTSASDNIATSSETPSADILWKGEFLESDWMAAWDVEDRGSWGFENIEVMSDPSDRFEKILRVRYPAGSASPSVSRETGAPTGGVQFYANLGLQPQDALVLSYYVRFSNNFDFVKGGKLPGLYGGRGNNGGDTPNGADGFSTRLMWRRQGDGEVYAYLPTSEGDGTSIGRGAWRFRPGVWHHIQQEIVLNQPDRDDGLIRIWFDGKEVLNETGVTFRIVDRLKIDGLFFSTFFGGGDPSWATPKDVYVDFADVSVSRAE